MWAKPGTPKVLCRNNSAGDPEPSVLWSYLRVATVADIVSSLSPACEIANSTFLTQDLRKFFSLPNLMKLNIYTLNIYYKTPLGS